ncbi:phosphodiester glycosidase family protein [Phormidium sp. CLA17]|uniref:phosphodiester glycosidase family protein n=1 Tax=Leptolyngbya sp. Cla-17 TaxID=2803751 RepID=UPI001491CCC5|nr:phosphodiester glycosidase family protein [Leptolyngbya sp. Cla-17]MBM0741609.1 phosphodiester glycosidase family protein [Leptolyngbya sp. Cla-17]
MRKTLIDFVLIEIGVGIVALNLVACRSPTPSSSAQSEAPTAIPEGIVSRIATSSPAAQTIEYKVYTLARSVVHTVSIPPQSQFLVTPAVSGTVEPLGELAQRYGAIAAINGGYFDPENQKSISPVTLQRNAIAKPEENERLMSNLNLLPYLDKILNRSEFRRYQCGKVVQYDITRRQTVPRADCQLQDSLGAGPQLLPDATLVEEGFLEIRNQKVIRDPLGINQLNARSAIGLTRNNTIIGVMVAQKPKSPTSSGMTLQELADFMKTLGVEKAINLDGGSSSSLYYQGKTVYGKVNESGQPIQRSIKSALLIQLIKKPRN